VGATEALPIETRILAATNRDLEEEVRRGAFRSDLFYRLNVISIHLPPLRDRREDIPLLANGFLERVARQRGLEPKKLSDDAMAALLEFTWPGNVRELENALERATILTTADEIRVEALPERVRERKVERLMERTESISPALDVIERAYIQFVLTSEGGNKTRAAEVLGIDPSTLHRKLARYDDAD
jgi:two-component system response regulator HydG